MCRFHVSKPDDDNLPPSRPHNGDTYDYSVRKRPGSVRHTSARNSKTIAIQHGSHQSVRVDLAPGQTVTRVSSKRVAHTSSPIATPDATRRASYILASDRDDGYHLQHSISPPLVVHAPTPPSTSPRVSQTVIYHDQPSPRGTTHSFTSYHSSHSKRSHHSRNGSHHSGHSGHSGHSRSLSHRSRSGSRSRHIIVDPPASDTRISRSISDAGQRRYSPGNTPSPTYGHAPRASMPSITHERSISRERSRERTSTGQSFLNPEPRRIEQGMNKNRFDMSRDGQVRGLLGGGDNAETVRIYGVNPRSSTGRVAARGGERIVVVDADHRRRYGSQ